jgi:pimeloyl-ACP methyl ester carboxylesterase
MAAYADDIHALLDALEIKLCALVGCSFGGMVALQVAVNWPERIAGLVLTDTSAAYANDEYDAAYREREAAMAAAEDAIRKLGPAGAAKLRSKEVGDEFLAAGIRARIARMNADGYLGAARVRRERPDLLGAIGGRLTMPVLICTGDRDPVHSASLVMAGRLPAARVMTFRGVGHGIPVLEPGLFTDTVLRFFADIEEGAVISGRRVI